MKILKFIGFVVLSLCIFSTPISYAKQSVKGSKVESNVQISDLQTQKKNTILNRLEKANLISTGIKKLGKNEQEDVVCLALNMYHEARGSTVKDQIASTYVVFNRMVNNNYPLNYKDKSICNIIFDRWQFCWTNGEQVAMPKVKITGERLAWERAQELALKLYTNPVHKELAKEFQLQHYVVTPLLYDAKRPKWINKRKLTVQIGKHSYMAIRENLEHNENNVRKIHNILNKAHYIIFGNADRKPTVSKIK